MLSIAIPLGPFVAARYKDYQTDLCFIDWTKSRPFGVLVIFMFVFPWICRSIYIGWKIIYWKLRTHWYHPKIPSIRYKKLWLPSITNLNDPLNTFYIMISIKFILMWTTTTLDFIMDIVYGEANFYENRNEVFLFIKIYSSVPHLLLILYFDRRYMLIFQKNQLDD